MLHLGKVASENLAAQEVAVPISNDYTRKKVRFSQLNLVRAVSLLHRDGIITI